jgi:hypothetical protein
MKYKTTHKDACTALRAHLADWVDSRIGADQIWARWSRQSPEAVQRLREAQLLMVGKPKLKPLFKDD